jgi:hypothetical protein
VVEKRPNIKLAFEQLKLNRGIWFTKVNLNFKKQTLQYPLLVCLVHFYLIFGLCRFDGVERLHVC